MARPTGSIEQARGLIKDAAVKIQQERQEDFALTDATGDRSTSRKKTRAERAAETAHLHALCDALYYCGGYEAPGEAQQAVEHENIRNRWRRGTRP
jgi:hypothetical protein